MTLARQESESIGRLSVDSLNGENEEKGSICEVSEGPPFENRVDGTRDVVREAMEYIDKHRMQNLHGR